MQIRPRNLLIASAFLLLASVGFALYVTVTRGFVATLENRSSRTLADLKFHYEDGVVGFPRLERGRKATAQFLARPNDGQGGEFYVEFVRKGFPGKDEDRPLGIGLFATKGRSVTLRLVDAPLPGGRMGVKLEGYWSEAFDWYRWYIRLRNASIPGRSKWPAMVLDEEP